MGTKSEQETWLKNKEVLPLVYLIDGKAVITERLLDKYPIDAIRGLMISKTIELEIACSLCDFLTAKKKALEEKAELLCYREAELYEKSYLLFCKTVLWLEEKGFKLDEFSHYALFNFYDGEWCEEVWQEPDARRCLGVLHHVARSSRLATSVTDRCICRLLHRH